MKKQNKISSERNIKIFSVVFVIIMTIISSLGIAMLIDEIFGEPEFKITKQECFMKTSLDSYKEYLILANNENLLWGRLLLDYYSNKSLNNSFLSDIIRNSESLMLVENEMFIENCEQVEVDEIVILDKIIFLEDSNGNRTFSLYKDCGKITDSSYECSLFSDGIGEFNLTITTSNDMGIIKTISKEDLTIEFLNENAKCTEWCKETLGTMICPVGEESAEKRNYKCSKYKLNECEIEVLKWVKKIY